MCQFKLFLGKNSFLIFSSLIGPSVVSVYLLKYLKAFFKFDVMGTHVYMCLILAFHFNYTIIKSDFLFKIPIWSYMLSIFSIKSLNIVIIVIFRPLSDLLIISESGSVACFVY